MASDNDDSKGHSPMTDPDPTIEPWAFDGGPKLPSAMLNPTERKRTGHLYKGCPNPVEQKTDRKGDGAVACEVCLEVKRAVDHEVEVWRALQEQKARSWREPRPHGDGSYPEPVPKPTLSVVRTDKGTTELPPPPPVPTPDVEMATDKQVAYLLKLACQKRPAWVNEIGAEAVAERARKLTRAQASAKLTELEAESNAAQEKQMRRGRIEAGYYALPIVGTSDVGNDIAFYRIDVPTEGKWKGYTFVKRVIGGKGAENVPRSQAPGILARIKDDEYIVGSRQVTDDEGETGTIPARNLTGPDAARMRYADNAVRCMLCNKRLTKLSSRIAGIGPVCESKGM